MIARSLKCLELWLDRVLHDRPNEVRKTIGLADRDAGRGGPLLRQASDVETWHECLPLGNLKSAGFSACRVARVTFVVNVRYSLKADVFERHGECPLLTQSGPQSFIIYINTGTMRRCFPEHF